MSICLIGGWGSQEELQRYLAWLPDGVVRAFLISLVWPIVAVAL